MKVCSKCNIEKEDSNFRIRVDKRRGNELVYLNNACLKCEAKRQRERTKKERSTPEGKAKHNKWAKEFQKRHREKILAYAKERRKTPEYKAYMKAYREARKEKIYQQEVITKKRYHEKNRDNITDTYAINLLRTQGYGTSNDIAQNQDLIELKKAQVLKKRIRIEILKKEKNVKENG